MIIKDSGRPITDEEFINGRNILRNGEGLKAPKSTLELLENKGERMMRNQTKQTKNIGPNLV